MKDIKEEYMGGILGRKGKGEIYNCIIILKFYEFILYYYILCKFIYDIIFLILKIKIKINKDVAYEVSLRKWIVIFVNIKMNFVLLNESSFNGSLGL